MEKCLAGLVKLVSWISLFLPPPLPQTPLVDHAALPMVKRAKLVIHLCCFSEEVKLSMCHHLNMCLCTLSIALLFGHMHALATDHQQKIIHWMERSLVHHKLQYTFCSAFYPQGSNQSLDFVLNVKLLKAIIFSDWIQIELDTHQCTMSKWEG